MTELRIHNRTGTKYKDVGGLLHGSTVLKTGQKRASPGMRKIQIPKSSIVCRDVPEDPRESDLYFIPAELASRVRCLFGADKPGDGDPGFVNCIEELCNHFEWTQFDK